MNSCGMSQINSVNIQSDFQGKSCGFLRKQADGLDAKSLLNTTWWPANSSMNVPLCSTETPVCFA